MTEPRVEAGDRALETARKQAEKWVDDHHPEPIKCIYCDEPQYTGPMASGALWGNCSKAPGKSHTYESTITTGNEREQRIAYLAEFGAVLIQSAMNAQDEATETRWQNAIYELCKKMVGPKNEHLIDGGGCDSGDALDFTLAEIGQAIGFWQIAADAMNAQERELLLLAGRLLESQSPEWGDVDGASIEEWLIEAGLIKQIDVSEPCDFESCVCAEFGFPTKCNRSTELGKRAERLLAERGVTK